LIKPPPGHGVAYIDWQQQEFGIAAALSGDPLMMDAYRSGDPYLAFAKQAGATPADATKATHKAIRIGQPPIRAHHFGRQRTETVLHLGSIQR